MSSIAPPRTAVALPGTGSSAEFVRVVFEPVLAATGIRVIAVDPGPDGIVATYRRALDDAAADGGPLLVAGISIGAAVGLSWAAEHPDRAAGVYAVLPPWIGAPGDAPAALSAAYTARQLRAEGLDAAIDRMRAGSPAWLADILTPSWRAQWPFLPDCLDEAAAYIAPTAPELARCPVPVAVVGAVDDPIHPFSVAEHWAAHLPNAALSAITLAQIGQDPTIMAKSAHTTLPKPT